MNRDIKCLRCGAELRHFARERLQLGKTDWILGDLPNLLAGALEVDIMVCPECRKMEFFCPEEAFGDETLPQRKCPVCGAVHDFDYGRCPSCKHEY